MMHIEVKTSLPYFGSKYEKGVSFMAKCKTINQDSEEKTDSGSNIQYEFVLES